MVGSRLPLLGTVAGVLVGTGIAIALVATGVLPRPPRRDLSDARGDFLAAWERQRRGTYVVDTQTRRRLDDGRTLSSAGQLAQRPPDRLIRQFGGISGTKDGHPLVCSTDNRDRFSCVAGTETVPPLDDRIAKELQTFRTYFDPPQEGARSLYRVVEAVEDGCYELFQQLPYESAPYGRYSKLCFDQSSGALRLFERHLDNGVVEIEEATSIRTDVRDGDFDTSSVSGFESEIDGIDDPPETLTPATSVPPTTTGG